MITLHTFQHRSKYVYKQNLSSEGRELRVNNTNSTFCLVNKNLF